jgi:hypothetical protein
MIDSVRAVVELVGGTLGSARRAELQVLNQARDVALQRGDIILQSGDAGLALA